MTIRVPISYKFARIAIMYALGQVCKINTRIDFVHYIRNYLVEWGTTRQFDHDNNCAHYKAYAEELVGKYFIKGKTA